MSERVEEIAVQVKAPYTALSLSGLKLRFGEILRIRADDNRVQTWLERGCVEIVPKTSPKKPQVKQEVEAEK